MTQGFNDNLYLIDLSYLNTPSEVVYDLSSILEVEPAKNQRVKLKLGRVDFNKSQLLSIKSLIESINSSLAIVEGKSDITRNAAISIGLVYQNSNDMVPDTALTMVSQQEQATTVIEEVTPELFPTISITKEDNSNQNNEEETSDTNLPKQKEETQNDIQPEGNSIEIQPQKFETTDDNLNFKENNHNWVEEQPQVQSFEEGFSNNNWAKPQSEEKTEIENNEKVNLLFDEQEEQQTKTTEKVELEPVKFASEFEYKQDNSDLMENSVQNKAQTEGIQTLEDIPLDIPKPEEIQEELDVIYSAERKLDDVFATTGIKEEKFQSLQEAPKVEEKEYTQYDFELEAFPTKYLKQTICAGQFISFEGNLIIIGDCHEGAEISAAGDITVWGELSGFAHAGKNGNEKSKIRALKMNASQLRIANCYAKRSLEDGDMDNRNKIVPEEAMIVRGEIAVYKIYKK
jgi:septum site-determining protein MinC